MSISSIVIIVLTVVIIAALGILFKTRQRLKEMEGFRAIKKPGEDDAEGVIDSFGEQ